MTGLERAKQRMQTGAIIIAAGIALLLTDDRGEKLLFGLAGLVGLVLLWINHRQLLLAGVTVVGVVGLVAVVVLYSIGAIVERFYSHVVK